MSLSAQASFLFFYESLISSELHKWQLKLHEKEKTKTYTKKIENESKSYLCMVVPGRPIFSANTDFL